ncbi:MAG TPA: serine/threonine-protein kinase, partial [Polyangiaceae bacterium]|nr:serine/threonine-protein kinase [Polyangiaceae bacterium]
MSLPDSIGGYEVVGRLAVGGMAEIFLGRQRGPHGFVRPVVIKRILPHLSHESAFVDMFLDEARIVAGIRHPNVVQIHEFGSESGELFLVMEYLEGENVGGILRRLWSHDRAMDPALAIHILAEACSGLHAAHELCDESGRPRQIVHRDVTPQNIFVTYDAAVKL